MESAALVRGVEAFSLAFETAPSRVFRRSAKPTVSRRWHFSGRRTMIPNVIGNFHPAKAAIGEGTESAGGHSAEGPTPDGSSAPHSLASSFC